MKNKYTVTIILFPTLLSVFSCETAAPQDQISEGSTISVKAESGKPVLLTQTMDRDESSHKTVGDPPVVFNYIISSDYLVRARVRKIEPVALVVKTEKNPNIVNTADLAAGTLFYFDVEELLCSKDMLLPSDTLPSEGLREFRIFLPVSEEFDEFYNRDGRSYLIFLKKVPNEDKEKLLIVYELDLYRSYFRAFQGKESIFPEPKGSFHAPPKKGIIEIGDPKHKKLISLVKVLCQAISSVRTDSTMRDLIDLTKSKDEELRDNALFAIRWLKKAKGK